jgi:hypothetical protein
MWLFRHSPGRESVFTWNNGLCAGGMLLVLVAVSSIALGCSRIDSSGEAAADWTFAVHGEDLGETYASSELSLSFRPPLGWTRLDDVQRQAVADALFDSTSDTSYVLALRDVFFSTETFSFAALSRIVTDEGEAVSVEEYEPALADTLEPQTDPAGVISSERSSFVVNGIRVIHYRHVIADRAGVTLLFATPDGASVRLDFSIPEAALDTELRKIESSIGTLVLVDAVSQ